MAPIRGLVDISTGLEIEDADQRYSLLVYRVKQV